MTRRKLSFSIKLKSIYLWHRQIGITAAFFTLILAITGILINHSQRLEFNTQYIQSTLLLNWYGIQAPELKNISSVKGHWLSQLGDRIYLDERPITSQAGELISGISQGEELIIATQRQLIITTLRGDIIEILDENMDLPSDIRAIALDAQGYIILHNENASYRGQWGEFDWVVIDSPNIALKQSKITLPITLQQNITADYLTSILSIERVLLDLHSGRLFGDIGVWVMDIAAGLLIALSLSGGFLWWRQQRSCRKKRI